MSYLGPPPARTPVTSAQITDASVTAAKLATDSVTTAKITAANVTAAKIAGGSALVGKNLIMNGSMAVAQRGSQAGVASGFGACDRWQLMSLSGAPARYTISQESSGGVGGNSKWNKILVTTADANPAAADTHYYGQKMEGNSVQTLLDSSGDLQACTMSFDVLVHADGASSISFPATLVIFVNDHGFDGQQYAKTFTVTSNDTWQRVSVPIAANASIAINNDTSDEFSVGVTIYAGSDKVISDATWGSAAGLDTSVSGAENLADVVNNYLGLTNVQLEVGSVATEFEHEATSVTLTKCQRYVIRYTDASVGGRIITGFATSGSNAQFAFRYPVTMRAAPTLTVSAAADFSVAYDATATNVTAISIALATVDVCRISANNGGGAAAGDAVMLGYDGGGTRFFQLSAEL